MDCFTIVFMKRREIEQILGNATGNDDGFG